MNLLRIQKIKKNIYDNFNKIKESHDNYDRIKIEIDELCVELDKLRKKKEQESFSLSDEQLTTLEGKIALLEKQVSEKKEDQKKQTSLISECYENLSLPSLSILEEFEKTNNKTLKEVYISFSRFRVKWVNFDEKILLETFDDYFDMAALH